MAVPADMCVSRRKHNILIQDNFRFSKDRSYGVALHTSLDVQRSKYIMAIIKHLHTNNVVPSKKHADFECKTV